MWVQLDLSPTLICQVNKCTEVSFFSFFSNGFITTIVVNLPERKLAKRTSVEWAGLAVAMFTVMQRFVNNRMVHRGAFCQFPFCWIYYYGSNKSTGKKTSKMHLCGLVYCPVIS